MNIDKKIKNELEKSSIDVDKIMLDNEGMFSQLSIALKGGMKGWIIFMYIIAVLIGLLIILAGYRFFIASELHDQIFWGVCVIVAVNASGFLKQWLFMEMQRSSIMREVKRVEVAVAQLAAKLG